MKKILQASNDLLQAYQTLQPITLPDSLDSYDEAYIIAHHVSLGLGPAAGWKIAVFPDGTRVWAAMPQRRFQKSPAQFSHNDFNHLMVECELAVVLTRDILARQQPYLLDDIRNVVDGLHVGIELVDSRLSTFPKSPLPWALADALSHGGFVLGSGTAALPLQAMLEGEWSLEIDGKIIKQGKAKHPMPDPLGLLVWFVNEQIAKGITLPAGSVITTGSFSGADKVLAGQHITARFSGIGEAELNVV